MSPKPSDNWGGLNEDAWTKILTHVPVKSVIKFKLVCKQWLSLISTRYFCRLHSLRRHKPPPSLIVPLRDSFNYVNPITQTAEPATMIPFTINLPNYPQIEILTSSNGLLLLWNGYDVYDALYVYNPTTKQSRKLSIPEHNNKLIHRIAQLHLVFNPSISIHYKIVCIRVEKRSTDTRIYQTEVFNSESGTWNVSGEPFTNPNELDRAICTYLNFGGAVHCNNMIYGTCFPYRESFYCFDIDRNALLFLPLPHRRTRHHATKLLQVSNDCVYYVLLVPQKLAKLWELRGKYEWVMKYHDEQPEFPLWHLTSYPLRFINIETSTILIRDRGGIMAYNFIDKSCKKLVDSVPYVPIAHQFAETLALV